MLTQQGDDRRVLEEAAAWFTRLKQSSISEATIEEFFAWRGDPVNADAYAEVVARWRQADRVRNDPELVALTEAALRKETLLTRWRRLFRRPVLPLSLASLALAGLLVLLVAQFRHQTYETDVGAQQIVRLDDGTVLRLNTDSKVAIHFGRKVRTVRLLRGEGFFEVAHDPARPFVVEAGATRVRALGTKFDVRRLKAGTQVTLLEGRVQVTRSSRPEAWTLGPNQQITVNGAVVPPRSADAAAASSWTTGRVRFHETPLAAAVAEMNRYSRTKIVLEADHLVGIRVSGIFETGNTQAFLSAVTELFGLEAVTTSDGYVLRSPAPASAD